MNNISIMFNLPRFPHKGINFLVGNYDYDDMPNIVTDIDDQLQEDLNE